MHIRPLHRVLFLCILKYVVKDYDKINMRKTNSTKNVKKVIKIIKTSDLLKDFQDFNKSIDQHLISTNYKPNKYRIITGKVLLDGFAYLTTCALLAFIIVTVLIQWMSI
jgi:hypothetical protein